MPWKQDCILNVILCVLACSSTIRDKIIPHAASWYTGEAVEGVELENMDDDDEEDDDEDEDIEEDDEESEDEDKEVEEQPKARKKVKVLIFSHHFHRKLQSITVVTTKFIHPKQAELKILSFYRKQEEPKLGEVSRLISRQIASSSDLFLQYLVLVFLAARKSFLVWLKKSSFWIGSDG